MTKRYISELGNTTLTEIFKANSKLREEVYSAMIDDELNHVDEQMTPFKQYSSYSISHYEKCFLSPDSETLPKFIEGVRKSQDDFCTLSDEEAPFLDEVEEKLTVYLNTELYSDEYTEQKSALMVLSQKLADMIVRQFEKSFEFMSKESEQLSYFLEYYSQERLENAYIIDGEGFTLYKDITQSYN